MLDTDSILGTTLWCRTATGAAGPGAISWYDHHLRPDPNVGKGRRHCLKNSAQNAMFDSSFCTLEWLDIGG